MNFANVKNLVIPEGSVKQIADSLGTVLWKKNEKFHIKNTDTKQITVSIKKSSPDAPTITLQVSDDGTTWISLGNTSTTALNITLPVGGKKYIRSTSSNAWGGMPSSTFVANQFSSTGKFSVNGNIMELLGYDTLKGYDCVFMFYGCSGLTKAPILPSMVNTSCYHYMFNNCTSLTSAPALPATILSDGCYRGMFSGCTSLTSAPDLPASTLINMCYNRMFNGCSLLSSIKCLATNISATNCTSYWVSGVAAAGTFVKASSMSGWTTGNNGIPSGWTVVNA